MPALRLWWLAVALLLTPPTQCKEFTNEDVRDGMLSIAHLVNLLGDKLERHEQRDRALGETLKRMLTNLDKKHREMEPLKVVISRLDRRLSNVETILLHIQEGERSMLKNTNEALESIKMSIQTLTTTRMEIIKPRATEINYNNLTSNDGSIEKRLDTTDSKIDDIKHQIENWKKYFNEDTLRSMCFKLALAIKPLQKQIHDAENLPSKCELKLKESNETKASTDTVQQRGVTVANEAWHSNMTQEMERQGKEITTIKKLLSDAEGVWKQLPKLADLHATANQTLEAIIKATANVNENPDSSINKVNDRLVSTNEDKNTQTQPNSHTDNSWYFDSLLQDKVSSLMKSENMMLQTTDNVFANNGMHQIVTQLNELILKQGKEMNATINDRLHHTEVEMLGYQALLHINLSSKIETEIVQVLRQINITHEQLNATRRTLDQLTKQTDHYVNSSTSTMGKLKDDVWNISGIMETLNGNLDRLGFVTQVRQISTDLASLKTDLQAVQANTGEGRLGPLKISSPEDTP